MTKIAVKITAINMGDDGETLHIGNFTNVKELGKWVANTFPDLYEVKIDGAKQ